MLKAIVFSKLRSCAPLAQSAERFHGKEKVDGSIPSGGSVIYYDRRVMCDPLAVDGHEGDLHSGGVAQLVRAHDS